MCSVLTFVQNRKNIDVDRENKGDGRKTGKTFMLRSEGTSLCSFANSKEYVTSPLKNSNVCAFSLYSFAPLIIRSVLWLRRYEMAHCLSQEKIFRYSHY